MFAKDNLSRKTRKCTEPMDNIIAWAFKFVGHISKNLLKFSDQIIKIFDL